MDFARKILTNYGWKEGDGLGKNKDGIAKPLKATLKFDNSGFGADQAAADFNNHWWERVYNEAATNVNIKKEGEKIKMVLKDDQYGVEISTKGYSMKKLQKLKKNRREAGENKNSYENFLQAATLTNLGDEVENPDKIDTNDIEVSKVKVLTDEELFKACGGRTAHKGARHGLKLSGKLLRIEQQEAELLTNMLTRRSGVSEDNQSQNILEAKTTKSKNIQDREKNKTKIYKEKEHNASDKLKKKKKRKHCEEEYDESVLLNQEIKVGKKSMEKANNHESKPIENSAVGNKNINHNPDDITNAVKKKKNKKFVFDNIEDTITHKKKKKAK